MNCNCEKYEHLEICRHAIYKRIQETHTLRNKFELIAEKIDENNSLFKCPVCSQLWQESLAWNWNSKGYLFKVPEVTIENWLEQSFVEPDKLSTYRAMLEQFEEKNTFIERNVKCRNENCENNAIQFSVFCKKHHIESLQKAKVLPNFPEGKLFEPYFL